MPSDDLFQSLPRSLSGFMRGLAIDYELTDQEISALASSLSLVPTGSLGTVGSESAIAQLKNALHDSLDDGVVDDEERAALLAIVQDLLESSTSLEEPSFREAVVELRGVLSGVLADDTCTEQEWVDLADQLEEYPSHAERWPFLQLQVLISRLHSRGFSSSAATEAIRGLASEIDVALSSANS